MSAVRAVLNTHHFASPLIIEVGENHFHAVSARPRSDHFVDMAQVEIDDKGACHVRIVSQQRGPTDWAILGPEFTADGDREAESIAKEIDLALSP